jgi:hypothetical protein
MGVHFDAKRAFNLIKGNWRFQIWGLDAISLVPEVETINTYTKLVEWIVKQYGANVDKPTSQYWIDHTPWNTQYGATLFELFPEAKMIHIVRDGRAVAASILSLKDWAKITTVDQAAHYWLERVAYGLAAESSYGQERVIRVRYEDLVCDPERELSRISAYLQIDYQPQMVDGCGFKVPNYTLRQHSLVGKPLDVTRIGAWENKLTPRQIEIFESMTGDMLRYLGYVPQYGSEKRPMTRFERLVFGIRKQYRWSIKRVRHQLRIRRVVLK